MCESLNVTVFKTDILYIYCYCKLCTDFPYGITDAVSHHVSFVQITCWLQSHYFQPYNYKSCKDFQTLHIALMCEQLNIVLIDACFGNYIQPKKWCSLKTLQQHA